MGNVRSSVFDDQQQDIFWNVAAAPSPRDDTSETRRKRIKEELDEFKLELARKHEKRRQLIAEKQQELKCLREEVFKLKQENEELGKMSTISQSADTAEINRLLEENAELRASNAKMADDLHAVQELKRSNLELKIAVAETQKELQGLNAEVVGFEQERLDYKNHVSALKDVVAVSKQMLLIRENQLKELREKVNEIEASLAGRELNTLSQDLQKEYERQLQNMRSLRIFYEERLRAHAKEKDDLKSVVDEIKKQLVDERNIKDELKETIERLEQENSIKYDEIKNLESNLGLSKAECRQFQSELSVINQLFSQILMGINNNPDIDMDRLIKLLEENHHLLQDIAINEESNQVSALPKVLLDLISEARDKSNPAQNPECSANEDDQEESSCAQEGTSVPHQLNSATEIVENLPKVWRVLIELLSHQCAPSNIKEDKSSSDQSCYKMVQTPQGSHLVLSVSKTFIRLKDLILEKKCLERETNRLKHLNTHLECRMQEQEKRLEMVSKELSETWHVVGKLQKKHQLLHTQEKILRYELAQKRKLLNELKEELEYSREKWQEAREKNSNTEREWKQLRTEFASRKKVVSDDYNNSVESGYSDGRECSSEDEPGYETDVSECNQKISSGDEAEAAKPDDEENNTEEIIPKAENVIMDVIQEELASIQDDFPQGVDNEGNSSASSVADDLTATTSVPGLSQTRSNLEQNLENSNKTLTDTRTCLDNSGRILQESARTLEKVMSTREERLLRLEGQANNLVKQVASTSTRSQAMCDKLDALHEIYGEGSTSTATEDVTETSESLPNPNDD